jgi:hypothetical protein
MINHLTCLPGEQLYEDFEKLPSLMYAPSVAAHKPRIPVEHLLQCIIIYKDGKPAARVALYDNPGIQHYDLPVLLTGAFECINDRPVAEYLFETCKQFAITYNKSYIIGPINGSTWEDYRLNIENTDTPFFSETIYPGYYSELWQHCGFKIFHTYYSSIAVIPSETKIAQPYSHIRSLRLDEFGEELSALYEFCMTAFAENLYFTRIDKQSFVSKYLQVKHYIDEEFVLLAEDEITKEIEAFTFCVPDIFDSTGTTLIIKTVAKDPRSNKKGLVTGMLATIHERAYKKGFRKMIHAFMHEENSSNKLSRVFNGEVFREYALFIKPVDNGDAV